MHTNEKLALALKDIGLTDMAKQAAQGYYHDFMSPLTLPELQLMHDLAEVGSDEAMALRNRVMNGDFDASLEESEAWAQSDEGQEVFGRLFEGK